MAAKPTLGSITLRRFESAGGALVYQIPLEEFPGFWGYVYLILVDDVNLGQMRILIDTGSGYGEANRQLEEGLAAISAELGEPAGLAELTHVLITHGHIDHFGGLTHVKAHSQAQIGVHELDRRILTHYEERLLVVARRLDEFLVEAGVSETRREKLLQLYTMTKGLFRSVPVDFTYEETGMRLGPLRFLHVPGHCAGHVVIRLDDILFSGDHVLEQTSPHQSPEHLTLSTGLDHYLQSLDKLEAWSQGVRLTLGGHKDPIYDLPGRLASIRNLHFERLTKVLEILEEPHTIKEISASLFGEVHGYNVLLALEEAGAHVEYLYQRGALGIKNIEDLQSRRGPVALQYCRTPGTATGFGK